MKIMPPEAVGDERADIQKISHGKSTSSSRTILLVRTGASCPHVNHREAGNRVFNDSCLRVFSLRGCEHDSILLDGNIERIAGANTNS